MLQYVAQSHLTSLRNHQPIIAHSIAIFSDFKDGLLKPAVFVFKFLQNTFFILFYKNSIILFRRSMGNSEMESNSQSGQCSTISLTLETQPQRDPLRAYLQNHTTFNVKTFKDVEKQTEEILSKSKLMSSSINQNCPLKLHNTYTKGERNQSAIIGETNTNPALKSSLSRSMKRSSDVESKFKCISISQQSFIKMKKEDPFLNYEMNEKLGEGNFGEVFRAVHKKSGEERAIKILKIRLMKQQKKKEFLAEMTLLSKLNHPSIITLYQLYNYKQKYYVVMEYCKGGSVIEALQRFSEKNERIIASIMKQLLSALSYMHSLNIIHRDIKLDNIVFLSKSEDCISIKIIDFGTAVQTPHKIVQNYPIAGTLSYLAPEVLKETLTEKSDIWSSGVLMYILLTGVSPFKGKNEKETKANIFKKIIDIDAPPLQEVSAEAKDLLLAMLNRSIPNRIQAQKALRHPWLSLSANSKPVSLTNFDQLGSYCRSNNFISVIESYLTLRKITQQERQKLAAIFTSIDVDGSGQIEREELMNIFKTKLSTDRHSDNQIKNIVQTMDINDSGKIDFNEFIIAMYDKSKVYLRESLCEAFEYFDIDHTGFIQIGELREMLKGGDKAEVQYFFSVLDTDSDSKISKEQFVEYLLAE